MIGQYSSSDKIICSDRIFIFIHCYFLYFYFFLIIFIPPFLYEDFFIFLTIFFCSFIDENIFPNIILVSSSNIWMHTREDKVYTYDIWFLTFVKLKFSLNSSWVANWTTALQFFTASKCNCSESFLTNQFSLWFKLQYHTVQQN